MKTEVRQWYIKSQRDMESAASKQQNIIRFVAQCIPANILNDTPNQ